MSSALHDPSIQTGVIHESVRAVATSLIAWQPAPSATDDAFHLSVAEPEVMASLPHIPVTLRAYAFAVLCHEFPDWATVTQLAPALVSVQVTSQTLHETLGPDWMRVLEVIETAATLRHTHHSRWRRWITASSMTAATPPAPPDGCRLHHIAQYPVAHRTAVRAVSWGICNARERSAAATAIELAIGSILSSARPHPLPGDQLDEVKVLCAS